MRISDWSSDVCSSDLEAAVLKAGELGIGVGDRGETLQRVRLQQFFHRRKRKRVVFLILLGGAGRAALGVILLILVGRGGGLLLFVLVLLEAGTGGLGADLAVAGVLVAFHLIGGRVLRIGRASGWERVSQSVEITVVAVA